MVHFVISHLNVFNKSVKVNSETQNQNHTMKNNNSKKEICVFFGIKIPSKTEKCCSQNGHVTYDKRYKLLKTKQMILSNQTLRLRHFIKT